MGRELSVIFLGIRIPTRDMKSTPLNLERFIRRTTSVEEQRLLKTGCAYFCALTFDNKAEISKRDRDGANICSTGRLLRNRHYGSHGATTAGCEDTDLDQFAACWPDHCLIEFRQLFNGRCVLR